MLTPFLKAESMEKKKDKRENFNTKQVLIESKTQMEDFLTVQFHAKKFYIVNLSRYTSISTSYETVVKNIHALNNRTFLIFRDVANIVGSKQRILRKEKNLCKENSSQRKGCKESKEKYC